MQATLIYLFYLAQQRTWQIP